jgi:hypothetical protein
MMVPPGADRVTSVIAVVAEAAILAVVAALVTASLVATVSMALVGIVGLSQSGGRTDQRQRQGADEKPVH